MDKIVLVYFQNKKHKFPSPTLCHLVIKSQRWVLLF